MDLYEQRQRWLNCLLVAVVVSLVFLLLCSAQAQRWMCAQVPHTGYRVVTAATLIFIAAFVATAVVFYAFSEPPT